METITIDIYYRPVTRLKNKPILKRLRLHPILSENGRYHELMEDEEGKIKIVAGRLEIMSERTQAYFTKEHKPRKKIAVDKEKFTDAVSEFAGMYEGLPYKLFNLRTNSRGFAKYVLEKSKF